MGEGVRKMWERAWGRCGRGHGEDVGRVLFTKSLNVIMFLLRNYIGLLEYLNFTYVNS